MTARIVLLMALLCNVAAAQVLSDTTEDGLVRVPSSIKVTLQGRIPDPS